MKNPAVSVIIPVYNAEKYIGECLDSLTRQTFSDFEVIVVDDCSTDNSREVTKKFCANLGDRLKILTLSKNSGCPSLPRNFALTKARGKYVYFLDSDDLLTETALEELYTVAESFEADVVHSEKGLVFLDEYGINSAKPGSFQTGEFVIEPTLETFDIGERVTGFTQKRFLWQAWGKLFRRKLLIENKILFPEVKNFEDFVFAFECLIVAKNYVRVPFMSYCYRVREDSFSHKAFDGVRFIQDIIGVVRSTNDFMSGRKFFVDNPQYKYMLTDFFLQDRLNLFSQKFIGDDYNIGVVYDLCKEIFSKIPQDNVALTAYLFIAMNIFKLYTTQQAAEIDKLKKKLEVSS